MLLALVRSVAEGERQSCAVLWNPPGCQPFALCIKSGNCKKSPLLCVEREERADGSLCEKALCFTSLWKYISSPARYTENFCSLALMFSNLCCL